MTFGFCHSPGQPTPTLQHNSDLGGYIMSKSKHDTSTATMAALPLQLLHILQTIPNIKMNLIKENGQREYDSERQICQW